MAIVITVIYIFFFTMLAHLSEHQIYFVKLFNGNLMNRDLWMTINAECIFHNVHLFLDNFTLPAFSPDIHVSLV